ncbi:MAG: hypothetical protein EBT10_06680, partial [Methylocystaceae bacterium]|nr:hypothetical protein [Methylocystaceae bacterium]
MLTSASVLSLCLATVALAQTPWLTTAEQAAKEAELIKDASVALGKAQELSPRPEIEAAIRAVNEIAGKLAQSPAFVKLAQAAKTAAPASTPSPVAAATSAPTPAAAPTPTAKGPDALADLIKDAKQWVSPTGDYANTRHSALKQITTENAGKLQLAWQFSTGVLRG